MLVPLWLRSITVLRVGLCNIPWGLPQRSSSLRSFPTIRKHRWQLATCMGFPLDLDLLFCFSVPRERSFCSSPSYRLQGGQYFAFAESFLMRDCDLLLYADVIFNRRRRADWYLSVARSHRFLKNILSIIYECQHDLLRHTLHSIKYAFTTL